MGMIVTGIVVAFVIAIGGNYFMGTRDDNPPAWQVYSSSSARVDDPGHNLVGPGWTGLGEVTAAEAQDEPVS